MAAASACRPQAFLFDMDGTLLDSEPSHCAAWRRAVDAAGSSPAFLTDEYFADWVGNPDVEGFCKAMIDGHGVKGTPAELAKVGGHSITQTPSWLP